MTDPPLFIVGCPRSGTSLVRSIMDGHPDLAVVQESHFLPALAGGRLRAPADIDAILARAEVGRLGLDLAGLRDEVARERPDSYSELVDLVFTNFSQAHGKARWADKTPGYVKHIPLLTRLFPGSRFVHVIRDGREVAASLAEASWGPPSAVSGAFWWRSKVQAGIRDGRRLGPDRYLELRLDQLIADPERRVRELCTFASLDHADGLLDYPERLRDVSLNHDMRHLKSPPTSGLREWRRGLTPRKQQAIESICHGLLGQLGYPLGKRTARGLLDAYRIRARDLLVSGPAFLRSRFPRAQRRY